MKRPGGTQAPNPALGRTSLIRELVHLSRFTESILNAMGSALVTVSEAGRITYVNPAAEALLGRPGADLLDLDADLVLIGRGGQGLLEEFSLPDDATKEADLELPGGRTISVDVRVSRLETKEGEAGGTVVILTDRTELKRAEQDARHKERLASLGELSAGVAHEIRNPLAGIASSADLLRSRLAPDDERRKLAGLILSEVARLDRIVESLLRFARPAEPSLRREDVVPLLTRALHLIEDDAARLGVEIATEFPPQVPPVWIDPDQILQVFLNIFRNALEAMEETGGTLRVRLDRVERAAYQRRGTGRRSEDGPIRAVGMPPLRGWVEIEVSDTGPGIPPDRVDRVFNPFYTTRKTGTGLGLPIVQAILQEHGGGVSLRSEEGRGTSVFVDLPEEKRQRPRRRE